MRRINGDAILSGARHHNLELYQSVLLYEDRNSSSIVRTDFLQLHQVQAKHDEQPSPNPDRFLTKPSSSTTKYQQHGSCRLGRGGRAQCARHAGHFVEFPARRPSLPTAHAIRRRFVAWLERRAVPDPLPLDQGWRLGMVLEIEFESATLRTSHGRQFEGGSRGIAKVEFFSRGFCGL